MYRKATVSVGGGTFCHAVKGENGYDFFARDGGRIVRRQLSENGKTYGTRQVSYADAYFAFDCGTLEVLGEEKIYAN